MKIYYPNNNQKEREYILRVIFKEFLGLNFEIICNHENPHDRNWLIILQNGNKLIFEDHFFSNFLNTLNYLNIKNIPGQILSIKNKFIIENDLPVIYGNSKLTINDTMINCGIDIFASCFFMLTRWEEHVNKSRDKHHRFSAYDSLSYKQGFLERPIVNEYIEMLWNMLKYLGINQNRKLAFNKIYLTHDVDELYLWKGWKHVFRVASGDVIKRKNLSLASNRIKEYYQIKNKTIKDPFETFDWLMDISDSIDEKSRFYFMSGGITEHDNRYKIDEPKSINLIEKIKKRKHIIGLHASYASYNNPIQFKLEKEKLEKTINNKISEGRQHYLRFEVPTTWQIWEENNMEFDSTCGYADAIGFRCGTGHEYRVFNILTRKELSLKERPLIIMDCSLFEYQDFNYLDALKKINLLKMKSNKMTLLWHNSYIKHLHFYSQFISSINLSKC